MLCCRGLTAATLSCSVGHIKVWGVTRRRGDALDPETATTALG